MKPLRLLLLLLLALPMVGGATESADDLDAIEFDDMPLKEMVQHPDWFLDDPFLDLREDLRQAIAKGKQALVVYFGQKRCPYCRQLMEVNFKIPDIVRYTREHFDVVAVDIWSPEEVTTPDGRTMSQRDYALATGTNFTPSLVFYDRDGRIALRLRGYYPPYQFRAALEYVAGGHYKRESFPVYLARGDSTLRFEADDLVEEDFFLPPPHQLDRSRFPGERPLAVFFEQGNCHACDLLHTGPLNKPETIKELKKMQPIQLNMWSNTPVVTPGGETTTARDWASELGIFHVPTIVFFDESGKEIMRIDSIVQYYRLWGVLDYINKRAYLTQPDYQAWRLSQRDIKK